MHSNKFWTASKTLAVVIVTLVVTLMLPPRAGAQSTEKVLYSFTGGSDGYKPHYLLFDQSGNLYGTTWGGDYDAGTIFKLTPNPDGSWTQSVLYSFTGGSDGYGPVSGGVAWDAAGSLYGGTVWGGLYGSGVLFKVTPNADGTSVQSVIHQFTGGADGSFPETTPFFDATGRLYAVASYGGAVGCGTAFEMTPKSNNKWSFRVIHQFKHNPACSPQAGLIPDTAGNLYGTTRNDYEGCAGAPNECGTVFKLTSTSNGNWTYRVIHKFTGGKGGSDPSVAGLAFDDKGNLYGTTEDAGAYSAGVFFKLTPGANDKWTYRVLHQFKSSRDGGNPNRHLFRDAAGNFYGTTGNGGTYGYGTVYKMGSNPDGTWTFSVLYNFAGSDGAIPSSGPIPDGAGNFYGITEQGGAFGAGAVYEITP